MKNIKMTLERLCRTICGYYWVLTVLKDDRSRLNTSQAVKQTGLFKSLSEKASKIIIHVLLIVISLYMISILKPWHNIGSLIS